MRTRLFLLLGLLAARFAGAQAVLFDFDNAPPSTPLPVTLTAGGVTATLSATGQGFSIQPANVMGFTPAGFSGLCVYPGSVFLADLLVRFDLPVTDCSLLYACNELGCDDAATMRITAYFGGAFVGTATRTATFPGTWPSDTLSCSFPSGFDSVVVHYDSPPPTCQDYGVIFMADNLRVTPLSSGLSSPSANTLQLGWEPGGPGESRLVLRLPRAGTVRLSLYTLDGKLAATAARGFLAAGVHRFAIRELFGSLPAGSWLVQVATAEGETRGVRVISGDW